MTLYPLLGIYSFALILIAIERLRPAHSRVARGGWYFRAFMINALNLMIFALVDRLAPETITNLISLELGNSASPVIGAYNISKAADFQLVRNLSAEYGPDNVRVNAIAPGLIKTDFARALWENPKTLERATSTTPLRRIGEPVEIAGAAVYLASDAGSFMTGQMMVVDGGQTVV